LNFKAETETKSNSRVGQNGKLKVKTYKYLYM